MLRKSLVFSAADSYVGLLLQLASTFLLSRILTPEEVGTFAVASVFSALASTFRDFGVAEYLIQEKEISTPKIRAALTVNIAISWLMALTIFSCAGLAGSFYHSNGIRQVMQIQAINFLLIPFGAVTMAWFRRQMNFKPIFIAGLAANATAFAVSVACALNGLGYMSLAWSSLAGVSVTVLVSLLFRPSDFPRRPGINGVGDVLRFGKFASGIYMLGQLGKGAPEMVIGRAQNIVGVAVFSRASGLIQIFHQLVMRAVMPVCLPYFSNAVREEGSVLRGYARGVAYLTGIGWPFLGFMAINAFPVIRTVYGNQWVESVPLSRILCMAGAVELVHFLAKEALLSHGHVKLSSRLQLMLQSTNVLGLLAVVPYGLMGGCVGLLVSSAVGLAISQWHLRVGIALNLSQVWTACRSSAVVTVIALAPVLASLPLVTASEQNFGRVLLLGGVATAAAWPLSLWLTRHPLWFELTRVWLVLARRQREAP